MKIHAMIDIETLNTGPDSIVLTIGGVKFDTNSDDAPYDDFYERLNIEEQEEKGRSSSDDTIAWWRTQPQIVQDEAFSSENRISVDEFFNRMSKWMVGVDFLWAHGVCFDITILENLARQFERPIPWNFWSVRDSRTLFSVLSYNPLKGTNDNAHNALSDAKCQAVFVQQTFSKIKIIKS